jgi:TIR domain
LAQIFVSYKHEDRAHAAALVRILTARGWSVWWDRDLRAGENWTEEIENELEAAQCVVVIWSQYSVGSRWVRTEAASGDKRKILVPVAVDRAEIPVEFREIQTTPILDWEHESPAVEHVVASIAAILHQPPPPPPPKWTARFWTNLALYCAAAAAAALAIHAYLQPRAAGWTFAAIAVAVGAALGLALFTARAMRQSRRAMWALLAVTVIFGAAYVLAPKPVRLVRIVPGRNFFRVYGKTVDYRLGVYRGEEQLVNQPFTSFQTVYVGAPKIDADDKIKDVNGDDEHKRQLREYMRKLKPDIGETDLQTWVDRWIDHKVAWDTARLRRGDSLHVVLQDKKGANVFEGDIPADAPADVPVLFLERPNQ